MNANALYNNINIFSHAVSYIDLPAMQSSMPVRVEVCIVHSRS